MRAESSEDLLSDSASVVSDISDSSINSSLLGKRNLAPPTKVIINVCKVLLYVLIFYYGITESA